MAEPGMVVSPDWLRNRFPNFETLIIRGHRSADPSRFFEFMRSGYVYAFGLFDPTRADPAPLITASEQSVPALDSMAKLIRGCMRTSKPQDLQNLWKAYPSEHYGYIGSGSPLEAADVKVECLRLDEGIDFLRPTHQDLNRTICRALEDDDCSYAMILRLVE